MARPRVTLYTRPDCHLCGIAKERIARVRRRIAFDLETLDISGDAALEAAYGTRIPVVAVDREEVAVYRVSEKRLARALLDRGARPRLWTRLTKGLG